MDIRELWLTIGIVILFAVMVVYYVKSKRRFAKILFGILSGVALLFPIQFLVVSMGAQFQVNLFTLSVSAVLGIPGVILMGVAAFL